MNTVDRIDERNGEKVWESAVISKWRNWLELETIHERLINYEMSRRYLGRDGIKSSLHEKAWAVSGDLQKRSTASIAIKAVIVQRMYYSNIYGMFYVDFPWNTA